jgi:hypothetical protein
VVRSGRSALWLPRVCLQRCRVCACAARMLCGVCMHWGRPQAELRAGMRWAPKLAWRFGSSGRVWAVRRAAGSACGAPLLAAARRRLGGGGEGEKEGQCTFTPPWLLFVQT